MVFDNGVDLSMRLSAPGRVAPGHLSPARDRFRAEVYSSDIFFEDCADATPQYWGSSKRSQSTNSDAFKLCWNGEPQGDTEFRYSGRRRGISQDADGVPFAGHANNVSPPKPRRVGQLKYTMHEGAAGAAPREDSSRRKYRPASTSQTSQREHRKASVIKDTSGSKPAAGKALAREMGGPAILKTADPTPAQVENPREEHRGHPAFESSKLTDSRETVRHRKEVRSPVARSSQIIFADTAEKADNGRPSSSAAEPPPVQEKSKVPGLQRQHSVPTDIFFRHSPALEKPPVKIRTAPGGGDSAAGEGLLAMMGRSSSDAALYANASLEDGARQHEAALLRSEHAHIAHEIPHISPMYTTPRGPRDRSPTCAAIGAAGRGRSVKSFEGGNRPAQTSGLNVKIQNVTTGAANADLAPRYREMSPGGVRSGSSSVPLPDRPSFSTPQRSRRPFGAGPLSGSPEDRPAGVAQDLRSSDTARSPAEVWQRLAADETGYQVTPQRTSSRAVRQHLNRSTIFNDQAQHHKHDQPVTWQVQDLTLSNLDSNISDKTLTSICQSFGHQVVHAKVEYDPLTHKPTGSAHVRLRTSSSRLSSTTDLISHLEKQRWVI